MTLWSVNGCSRAASRRRLVYLNAVIEVDGKRRDWVENLADMPQYMILAFPSLLLILCVFV